MTTPTVEQWRALARSSPWLWRSVHFELHRRGPHTEERLAAWLRRPGDVRVEADHKVGADGTTFVARGQQRGPNAERGLAARMRRPGLQGERETGADGTTFVARGQQRGPQPRDRPVRFGPDRLVVSRESRMAGDDHGLYYQDYYWLALLDPLELADGMDREDGRYPVPGTEVTDVEATLRHGRETWWARVWPLAAYEPRCSCCALMYGVVAETFEFGAAGQSAGREPGFDYTTEWLAGLDRATGLCVSIEGLDGTNRGQGHSMTILAVDEDYPDSLFTQA